MTGYVPLSFTTLTALTSIELFSNSLTNTLPEAVGVFTNLVYVA